LLTGKDPAIKTKMTKISSILVYTFISFYYKKTIIINDLIAGKCLPAGKIQYFFNRISGAGY